DAGENLDVEVDVVRGAFLVVAPGRDLADDLSFGDALAVQNAFRVHVLRIHVQVPKSHALVRSVDDNIDADISGQATNGAVMDRRDSVLVGQAAVGLRIAEDAVRRPDIFALMAVAARTLAHEKIPQLAEIVAPRIGEIFRGGLVEN